MKRRPSKNQSGFALFFFVLAIMGAGGLLFVGFSEGMLDAAESKKLEHNKRVLKEAKQALLQFAYNYPVTNDKGPGRLPCADIDNDGIPDPCSSYSSLGRLPWSQGSLNLYDIRDAEGERLWYAVSSKYTTQEGPYCEGELPDDAINETDCLTQAGIWTTTKVNSDTSGNITLRDQQGNVIYDGSNPGVDTQYGIVAVIIAPGDIIDRNGVSQDRSVANADDPLDTTADTDPGIIDATNYLDRVFGTEDNAGFANSSATDGFILGPIEGVTNDQFIVITAAEVAEMAEKAAMQAYRTAIEDYRVNTSYCVGETPANSGTDATICAANGGTWTLGPYPWLYNYAGVTSIADMSSYYPADPVWATEETNNLTSIGRIPTTFTDYFTESDGQPIDTELYGSVAITYPAGLTYNRIEYDGIPNPGTGEFAFNDGFTPPFYLTGLPTDVQFVNIGAPMDNEGRLTTNFAAAEPPITLDLYFWDDDEGSGTGFYTPCGDDGDGIPELTDCHRADLATSTPGSSNGMKLFILHIRVTLGWAATPGIANFDLDYTPHCEYEVPDGATTEAGCLSAATPGKWFPNIEMVPATADSHAIITATFHASHVINGTMPALTGTATYEECPHYHSGFTPSKFIDPICTNFSTGTVDLVDFSVDELTLGMRYYPEIPAWAFDNGWHNSMILHYAERHKPGGTTLCDINGSNKTDRCIWIRERTSLSDEMRNKDQIAVLLNTGEHGWVDGNADGDFKDSVDRDSVAEYGNREFDYIVRYKWPGDPDSGTPRAVPPGNDNLLILEELP